MHWACKADGRINLVMQKNKRTTTVTMITTIIVCVVHDDSGGYRVWTGWIISTGQSPPGADEGYRTCPMPATRPWPGLPGTRAKTCARRFVQQRLRSKRFWWKIRVPDARTKNGSFTSRPRVDGRYFKRKNYAGIGDEHHCRSPVPRRTRTCAKHVGRIERNRILPRTIRALSGIRSTRTTCLGNAVTR